MISPPATGRVAGWLFAVMLAIASAAADTIKLKDGTVLDGTILSEDDHQVIIEVRYASGTITKQETVNKADIAELTRLTAEQKAYQATLKYQLDPNNSYPQAAYYDQVITSVFRRFLADYPQSTNAGEVSGRIAQWEAERDRVAGGQVKHQGTWMSTDEARPLIAEDRAQQLLEQARALISQGIFERAIQYIEDAVKTTRDSQRSADAGQLKSIAYQKWIESLRRQQQLLNSQILSDQERLGQTRQSATQKESKARTLKSQITDPAFRRMGQDSDTQQADADAQRAQTDVSSIEQQLTQARQQLAAVEQRIAEVQARASAAAAQPTAVAQVPATTQPAPSVEPQDQTYLPPTVPLERIRPTRSSEPYRQPVGSQVPVAMTSSDQFAQRLAKGSWPFYMIAGLLLAAFGGIWLLVVAFRESVLWGLGVVFIPFVSVIFAIIHWDDAKWPFLINLAGTILFFVGVFAMIR